MFRSVLGWFQSLSRTQKIMIAVFILGLFIGRAMSSTEVEHDVITKTLVKEVKVPGKTVTKTSPYPDACIDQLKLANDIALAAGDIDSGSSNILDYLSQVRVLAVTDDTFGANQLENEVRSTRSKHIATSAKLAEDLLAFQTVRVDCQEALSEQ